MFGSWPAILFSILIYTFTGLSLGLMISTVAKSQQVAMLMTLMITVLPTIMLSGFIFPVESMPRIFSLISNIIPAKHFVRIIRGIMLKGLKLSDLIQPIVFLSGLSLLLIMVSIKKFKNRLE
jgi:ABC-2 type transport system permease protein